MGIGDGSVLGHYKYLDNGSDSDRFTIAVVSEGYRLEEMDDFHADFQDFVDQLVSTSPLDEFASAFNVYRIDVSSTESGADDPAACPGGAGTSVATYFDASFCNGGIRRLTSVNTGLVIDTVDAVVSNWNQILVLINSPIWGGSGGVLATMSTSGGWVSAALHELGHAAFGLADEYEYWAGCGSDVGHDTYTGGEPAQPNVTIDTNRATIKWGDLIDPATPLPTTVNADCAFCDPQPNPLPAGAVGAFEGARYYHCGIYRPEFNCMMRNLAPFCAVCQRRIRETLQPYLPHIHPDWDDIPWRIFEEFQYLPEWILEKWILVAYLMVDWRSEWAKEVKTKPSKQFYSVLAKHMTAYLRHGKKPPADIAATIMNLTDDYLAGKQMTLRAGDYIAVQNHLRSQR